MKKIETFLQKYFGFITLGAYALFAIFALGRGTAAAPCKYYESRKNFYKPIQPYNNLFRILSIIGLLLGALYRVRRCHTRLVYYVSNFVWFGILIVLSVLSGIFLLYGTILYSAYYNLLPFEERNTYFVEHSLSMLTKGIPLQAAQCSAVQPSLSLDISLLFSSLFLLPLLLLFLSIRSKAVSVTRITRNSVWRIRLLMSQRKKERRKNPNE